MGHAVPEPGDVWLWPAGNGAGDLDGRPELAESLKVEALLKVRLL